MKDEELTRLWALAAAAERGAVDPYGVVQEMPELISEVRRLLAQRDAAVATERERVKEWAARACEDAAESRTHGNAAAFDLLLELASSLRRGEP